MSSAAHVQAESLLPNQAPAYAVSSQASRPLSQKPYAVVQPLMSDTSSSNDLFGLDAGSEPGDGASASHLAGKLHSMQVDAMDRAWQKQQHSQRLLSNAAASTTAPVNAVPTSCWPRHPTASSIPSSNQNHGAEAVDINRQQLDARGRQQGRSIASEPSASSQETARPVASGVSASKLHAPTASTALAQAAAARSRAEATFSTASDHHGADMSRDTESLVAKLRALSQGRNDPAQGRAANPAGQQQQQRLPFAARTTNSSQRKLPSAHALPLPPAKRSKQVSIPEPGCRAVTTSSSSQRKPDAARCIQLMEPVHSGTEYESGVSSEQHSRGVKLRAGSPSAASRRRASYASVAAPIQLAPPAQASSVAAVSRPLPSAPIPAAAAAAPAEASSRMQQQLPGSPVQHRLGKPTPLKKGFTPKPTRFRLETERLSITPPGKPSGLEKVLFTSPVKLMVSVTSNSISGGSDAPCCAESAAEMQTGHLPKPDHEAIAVTQDVTACCDALMTDAEHGQQLITPPAVGTPAPQDGVQVKPEAVFSHMRVILDPELSLEETNRYSAACVAMLLAYCIHHCHMCDRARIACTYIQMHETRRSNACDLKVQCM